LESDAVIHGYAKVAGPLALGEKARVTLGSLVSALAPVEEFRWHVEFSGQSAGDRRSDGSSAQRLELAPGRYGGLFVEPRSTIIVRTGTYWFKSLSLPDQATLEIDNSDGPVYIWVEQSLELDGVMRDLYVASNILIGYAGQKPLVVHSTVRATLVAPWAKLDLHAARAPHRGAFFARSIDVEAQTVVRHRAFNALATVLGKNNVCGQCRARVESEMRNCCERGGKRSSAQGSSAGPVDRPFGDDVTKQDVQRRCISEVALLHRDCEIVNGFRPGACPAPSPSAMTCAR
jgi:hypothetical protein